MEKCAENWRTLQLGLDQQERDHHADLLAEEIRKLSASCRQTAPKSATSATLIDDLQNNGIALLGNTLDQKKCEELVNEFRNTDCFDGHTYAQSDKIPKPYSTLSTGFPFASYHTRDIINAPYLIELANCPEIIALVESYLGCIPSIYSVNAWWSFPAGEDPARLTQSYHRDSDDFRFISLFVYLTDVDELAGPHQYVSGTHTYACLKDRLAETSTPPPSVGGSDRDRPTSLDNLLNYKKFTNLLFQNKQFFAEDEIKELLGSRIVTVTGDGGTSLLVTPAGFHRGIPPIEKPRLMFWARYGMYQNIASVHDKIKPVSLPNFENRIENTDINRYINRLIIDPHT
jgi:hypothetical protein